MTVRQQKKEIFRFDQSPTGRMIPFYFQNDK